MKKPRASGFTAVMNSCVTPPDSLNFFPTPPWAVRGFIELVLCKLIPIAQMKQMRAHECCAGEGHMAETMRRYFGEVYASDVFDYGVGYDVEDILDPYVPLERRDVLMTNPPFPIAMEIVLRALKARIPNVFVVCRSNWIEGIDRYQSLFEKRPPTFIAPYVERVPMVEGRYDAGASSATSYSWFGWVQGAPSRRPETFFIPPHRKRFEFPEDIRRWCKPAPAPLFEGDAA